MLDYGWLEEFEEVEWRLGMFGVPIIEEIVTASGPCRVGLSTDLVYDGYVHNACMHERRAWV